MFTVPFYKLLKAGRAWLHPNPGAGHVILCALGSWEGRIGTSLGFRASAFCFFFPGLDVHVHIEKFFVFCALNFFLLDFLLVEYPGKSKIKWIEPFFWTC